MPQTEIRELELHEDETQLMRIGSTSILGRRVNIEQIPQATFLLMFMILDFHIDINNPHLEGKSYRNKYINLSAENDSSIILKGLFRIAKVIISTLVQNPSMYKFKNEKLDISYEFNNTNHSLIIPLKSLDYLYALIVKYVENKVVNEYNYSICRSLYD